MDGIWKDCHALKKSKSGLDKVAELILVLFRAELRRYQCHYGGDVLLRRRYGSAFVALFDST